jgi:hypothetical protein
VGRGAGSGWNTPTPANTWNTEGTPSYTASSLSGGASLGETGPSAGVGQSSLDDVCDVCVGLMFVCFQFSSPPLSTMIKSLNILPILSNNTSNANYKKYPSDIDAELFLFFYKIDITFVNAHLHSTNAT